MRRNPTYNLAFIDIMSCGLGAVILILVLLKNHQTAPDALLEQDQSALDQQIADLLSQQQASMAKTQADQSEQSKLDQEITQVRAKQSVISVIKSNTLSTIERLQLKIQASQRSLDALTAEAKSNRIETTTKRQEEYLVGLNIEGQRIAILVDSSASMTARELIKVTSYKVQSDAKRKSAAKWQRTLRIVQWLLARAPENSELLSKPKWLSVKDKKALAKTMQAVESVAPYGATNLEQAINKVLKHSPDAIYLITDGLPTQGLGQASILSSGGCGGITSSKKIVSGECRVTLLRRAASLTNSFKGKLSITLLPLEGDPQAAPELSKWVLSTGGTLISPAASWP